MISLGRPFVECSGPSGIVANSRQISGVTGSESKNNRKDGEKLARLAGYTAKWHHAAVADSRHKSHDRRISHAWLLIKW